MAVRRKYALLLVLTFPHGSLLCPVSIDWDSPAIDPGNVQPEPVTQFDGRWVQWRVGELCPEGELVASTATLVAVVAAVTHVDGERDSATIGFAVVQRAVSIPLISSMTNALEAQQVKYVQHGDVVAKFVEIDPGHGR